MSTGELVTYSRALRNKQDSLLSSLPGRGVRALLRKAKAQQIDGSLRHIEYRFSYLLNGFVAYVADEDIDRLRSLPEVKEVHEIQPVSYFLDKAIDYSLGTHSGATDRRLAVYGANQEFSPSAVPGHPEAPSTSRIDGFEGQNIKIAVIDSGVDWRHPMFGGIGQTTPLPRISGSPESPGDNKKVIYYYALSSPGDPTDDFGHGTLVASCAAGYSVDGNTLPRPGYGLGRDGQGVGPTPNNVQLFGTAPQAQIMAYKVCGPSNACPGDIDLAIEDAASPFTLVGAGDGNSVPTPVPKPVADVINLSLGDTTGDPAGSTSRLVNNAALAGTIVVASAGNAGPGPGTVGAPSAATLAISVAASLDPGSTAVGDVLAPNQIPGETGASGSEGPAPETGGDSSANLPQAGERQAMTLFPVAGGGPIPHGSLSSHYVFVDRRDAASTIPPEVRNRVALVKGSGTFAQIANAVAPFNPSAILIITTVESATAVAVLNGIPTFTIGPGNGNYLIDRMRDGDPGDGDDNIDVPQGMISQFPLRLAESATFETFQPSMAGFSSRGPNDHGNARFRTIKPDVTGPGVGIVGAATVEGLPDETVGLASTTGYTTANGTSFSGPITAGAMALIRQRVREELGLDTTNLADPAYRSKRFDTVTVARALLMNTATNLRSAFGVPQADGAASVASINDMGAGHINIAGALQAKAIMVAPTLLLSSPREFNPTSGVTPNPQGNLRVLIPSASFGAVPIVDVDGTVVRTQEVIIRDITSGAGSGTYNLSFQNNRHVDGSAFQVSFASSPSGTTTVSSISVPAGGQASFYVRVAANGNLINVDPTEFQWYVTATHAATGQNLRMPFYFRAVRPEIPNITSPIQQEPQGTEQPAPSPSDCSVDTNGAYHINWTYTKPNGGPEPVGFRVQEGTRSEERFFDDANTLLIAGANSRWTGSAQWTSQVNPNTGSFAYYVPDVAQQNESLAMVNSIQLPAGGATLSFTTTQNLEDD
ncbi:MAG TPA: S8 family serine peptidase, partial [Blastocatellia bacterium]|nr:S8 family serine peptidase [Blastocatellia bacterium]